MKTTQALSGQPLIIEDGQGFRFECCACNLTHFIHVRIDKKKMAVKLTFYLDEFATKENRKRKKKK